MNELNKIVKCIKNGGVALLPTDTVYGLAACPADEKAVNKIFELKSRPRKVNLPIMVSCVEDLYILGVDINPAAVRLFSSAFVPGDITIILGFKSEPTVDWLKGREECAVRIPNDDKLLKILQKTGPLLVTSANKHKEPITPDNIDDILLNLNGKPDIVIEGGIVKNIPSTIVNCRVKPPVIERTGRILYDQLFKILKNE